MKKLLIFLSICAFTLFFVSQGWARDGRGGPKARIFTNDRGLPSNEINTDPGSDDDAGKGYKQGDFRMNVSDGTLWFYVDSTIQWVKLAGSGSGASVYIKADGTTAGVTPWAIVDANGKVLAMVNGAGNVGIGTSSPDEELHVKTASWSTIKIESTGAATDPFLELTSATDEWDIRIDESDSSKFEIRDGADTRLAIDTSGNVGIGTASPGNLLDVSSGTTSNSIAHFGEKENEGGYLTSTTDSSFIVSAGAEFDSGGWRARSTAASIMQNYNGVITFFTDTGLTDGNTFPSSARVTIDSLGNVGIGTRSPNANTKLDVQGLGSFTSGVSSAGEMRHTYQGEQIFRAGTTGFHIGDEGWPPTVDKGLQVDWNTFYVDAINDRVGVGTVSPTCGLEVIDNARIYSNLTKGHIGLAIESNYEALTVKTIAGSTIFKVNVGSGAGVAVFDSSGDTKFAVDNTSGATFYTTGNTVYFGTGGCGIFTSGTSLYLFDGNGIRVDLGDLRNPG